MHSTPYNKKQSIHDETPHPMGDDNFQVELQTVVDSKHLAGIVCDEDTTERENKLYTWTDVRTSWFKFHARPYYVLSMQDVF